MIKKYLLFINFILIINIVSCDTLLINNGYINYMSTPHGVSQYNLNHNSYYPTISPFYIQNNAQAIKITDEIGTITSIKIYLQRYITNSSLPYSNITLKIYKSLDDTPTSDKYLWDSFLLNPSSESIQSFLLTFDYPIEVYDNQDNKLVNWLWIELSESYSCSYIYGVCIEENTVLYGYYNHLSDNKYIHSDKYQKYLDEYTLIESHFSPPWYNDIAFQLFGTWHYPQTPLPTPTQTTIPIDNPEIPDEEIPELEEGTYEIPDFNNGTQNYPNLPGNETIKFDRQSNISTSNFLIGLGYCTSEGCNSDDFISFLYDIILFLFLISLIIPLIKIGVIKK